MSESRSRDDLRFCIRRSEDISSSPIGISISTGSSSSVKLVLKSGVEFEADREVLWLGGIKNGTVAIFPLPFRSSDEFCFGSIVRFIRRDWVLLARVSLRAVPNAVRFREGNLFESPAEENVLVAVTKDGVLDGWAILVIDTICYRALHI